MEPTGRRLRRAFTDQYKAEVVELCRTSGKTVGAIARDLGLTATAVRRWVVSRLPIASHRASPRFGEGRTHRARPERDPSRTASDKPTPQRSGPRSGPRKSTELRAAEHGEQRRAGTGTKTDPVPVHDDSERSANRSQTAVSLSGLGRPSRRTPQPTLLIRRSEVRIFPGAPFRRYESGPIGPRTTQLRGPQSTERAITDRRPHESLWT